VRLIIGWGQVVTAVAGLETRGCLLPNYEPQKHIAFCNLLHAAAATERRWRRVLIGMLVCRAQVLPRCTGVNQTFRISKSKSCLRSSSLCSTPLHSVLRLSAHAWTCSGRILIGITPVRINYCEGKATHDSAEIGTSCPGSQAFCSMDAYVGSTGRLLGCGAGRPWSSLKPGYML